MGVIRHGKGRANEDGKLNMRAYYNEHDGFCVQWLRRLIEAGLLPDGDVDSRNIQDVTAGDLVGYDQCHFFAGLGGWAYALQLANWPTDAPVWTGSCPCQPFSSAGKRKGFKDDRHLWPEWFKLIDQRHPPVVFGEQVASKAGLQWFDAVSVDLEGTSYAVGAADLCAAGVGAPHIRQRLWFVGVADTYRERCWRKHALLCGKDQNRGTQNSTEVARCGPFVGVADSMSTGRAARGTGAGDRPIACGGSAVLRVDDASSTRRNRTVQRTEGKAWHEARMPLSSAGCGPASGVGDTSRSRLAQRQIPKNGLRALRNEGKAPTQTGLGCEAFWSDADWLLCKDGKFRPVEPGTFPLVDGAAYRVGSGQPQEGMLRSKLLKAYGNAIVPQVAAEFVAAYMEGVLAWKS